MSSHLKRRLQGGDVLVGATLGEYTRASLVKLFRDAGFDFLYFENEHAAFNPADLADTALYARALQFPMVAKVPQLQRAAVASLLEMGITGIQLPRTETAEEVAELVDYVKFPPVGSRSAAPGLGNTNYERIDNVAAWLRQANDETLVVAHIETAAGLANIESIVVNPHVDVVFIGMMDFSISLGRPGALDHPEVAGGVERILSAARAAGTPTGMWAESYPAAHPWIARGMQFFESADELALIAQGGRALVEQFRAGRCSENRT